MVLLKNLIRLQRPFSTVPQEAPKKLSFRELGKKYGWTGFAIYSCLSTTTLSIIFVSIWNGIDVNAYLNKVKSRFGWEVENKETEPKPEENQSTVKKTQWDRIGTTFVLAFAANKLLVPIKIPLTMMLTPMVYRRWQLFWHKRISKK